MRSELGLGLASIALGGAGLWWWLAARRRRENRAPSFGILNFLGAAGEALGAADREALSLPAAAPDAAGTVPQCDVLLVYADVRDDGTLEGTVLRLADLVARSGARCVILASPNRPRALAKASADLPAPLDVVMTQHRQDGAFTALLGRIFRVARTERIPLTVAWERLRAEHPIPEDPGRSVLMIASFR